MSRSCLGCGASLEGKRADALTCSARCKDRVKKRRQRSSVVALPSQGDRGDAKESELVVHLVDELDAAGRLETTEGQHAVFLARRLVTAEQDTGSGVASLSKEFRAAKVEALKGAQVARSRMDELRARRDAKRGA